MYFLRNGIKRIAIPAVRHFRFHQQTRKLVVDSTKPPTKTVKEVRNDLQKIVGSSKTFREGRNESVVSLALAKSQDELSPRVMSDSYSEACIPIGSDLQLRDKYANLYSTVRFGRILEDLDTMAVVISYNHNRDPASKEEYYSPLSIVTAAVDRIDVKGDIFADEDVYIRGHVTYVGQTSIEVTMYVDQAHAGTIKNIMQAKFITVARDPQNVCKAYIHPLKITSSEEEALFKLGQANKNQRLKQAKQSLLKIRPNEIEGGLIHDLFLSTVNEKEVTFRRPVLSKNAVWMDNAKLKNIILCHPDKRNLYNKIFGGYIMRQAFEIGWVNACVYSKMRPATIAIDDIMFRRPVLIGSLLYFSSQIVYTNGPHMQVKVHAEIVDPRTAEHTTTNTFYMTFGTPEHVPQVMPKSYAEYMSYLAGRRHYEESMKYHIADR